MADNQNNPNQNQQGMMGHLEEKVKQVGEQFTGGNNQSQNNNEAEKMREQATKQGGDIHGLNQGNENNPNDMNRPGTKSNPFSTNNPNNPNDLNNPQNTDRF